MVAMLNTSHFPLYSFWERIHTNFLCVIAACDVFWLILNIFHQGVSIAVVEFWQL